MKQDEKDNNKIDEELESVDMLDMVRVMGAGGDMGEITQILKENKRAHDIKEINK
ncbi:hypothetical protein [Bacillus sp. V5-8f]|uniref:hypothetical protein n=1 Tax=Bacillus sp. V5-8f TaxID=2053044 RepID=UPI0015E0FD8D|nr:hypothetical protein [Bacillus sp. V5-8f]